MTEVTVKKTTTNLQEENTMQNLNENYKVESTPYTEEDFHNNVFGSYNYKDDISYKFKFKKAILLIGAPGKGKTTLAKNIAYKEVGFVDSYRILDLCLNADTYHVDLIDGITSVEGVIKYKKGSIMEHCELAQKEPQKPFFIILDEMNRANLGEALGELIQCMRDRGHSVRTNEGGILCVPDNVHFIATMNTYDKTLPPVELEILDRFKIIDLNKTDKFTPTVEQIAKSKNLDISTTNAVKLVIDAIDRMNMILKKDEMIGEDNILSIETLFSNYDSVQDIKILFEEDIAYKAEYVAESLYNSNISKEIQKVIEDTKQKLK